MQHEDEHYEHEHMSKDKSRGASEGMICVLCPRRHHPVVRTLLSPFSSVLSLSAHRENDPIRDSGVGN